MKTILRGMIAAMLGLWIGGAQAQSFPVRPVTMIVPYAPGGTGDILGRALARRLSAQFGQQVVIENRGGAGGNLGADLVARNAAPDGYTILLTATSLASNPSLMKSMPFDPLRDLAAVGSVASISTLAVVNPRLPIRSIGDLIAQAKANPGKLTFGSSGHGTSNHLAVELFKVQSGVDMLHVPYKSAGQALPDLLSGQIDLMFDLIPSAINHARQGTLRPLAVTSSRRSTQLPEVPTVAESGVPGYEFVAWFGVFAPAATPRAVINQLNAGINQALESSEFKAILDQQGAEPFPGTPEQFDTFFKNEVKTWARVVRDGKLPTL
jgi:tripartite-type tricarboxylate transporter receptor subunit TctC